MIPRITRGFVFVALIAAGSAAPASAQLTETLGALSGENAKGYLSPLPKALSATLNAGIFQSGYVKKSGFSLSLGVKVMGIEFSDDDRTYTPVDPPGFTSTASVQAPTIVGGLTSVAQPGQGGTTLYHPGGLESDNFALAVPQLEIGTAMGTRAVVRWISLDVSDSDFGKFEVLGIGAQHSLSQHLSSESPIDLAIGAFWQTFKIDDELVDATSLHFDITASRRFSIFEPYAAVGYDKLDMETKYESTTSPTPTTLEVKFDSETNAHFTAGLQAWLGILRFHAEANFAAENGVAAGFSIGR